MQEFLSGVGALAVFVIGGGWVMAQLQNRKYDEDFDRELRYLDGKRKADPGNAAQYDEEIKDLIRRGPRRAKLFN